MRLHLCHSADVGALAVQPFLRERLPDLRLVTAEEISSASKWEHRLDSHGAVVTRAVLPDGSGIDGECIDGVLNRLMSPCPVHVLQSTSADREYALGEYTAFFLSWLNGLRCPVIGRATPQGLCGRWRQPLEWVVIAQRSGMEARVEAFDESWTGLASPGAGLQMPGVTVIVAFGKVFSMLDIPSAVSHACQRFAVAADCDILGLEFATGRGWGPLVGVTPVPDLRLGGELLLDAIAGVLRG